MSKANELRSLLLSKEKNEIDCGKYLDHAVTYLLPKTPFSNIVTHREERSVFGSSDFIIAANFRGDTGKPERIAYIWEIKAPQCYLMTSDSNKTRFKPTTDLYKAENQLIHYVHEAKNNGVFRDKFGVGATGEVCAGGIIIGTDESIVSPTEKNSEELAQASLNIRKEYLYRSTNLRIMTWSRILDWIESKEKTR